MSHPHKDDCLKQYLGVSKTKHGKMLDHVSPNDSRSTSRSLDVRSALMGLLVGLGRHIVLDGLRWSWRMLLSIV